MSWTPPTPGRAVLRATLWPLVGLMARRRRHRAPRSRASWSRSARRLEAALAQARAADRTKTEFLSNVSHELRTPLNGVIGVAQLLQLREQEPEARHMLEILLASARSQLQLVNGLLDIARIETGSMTLEQAPFDPAAVLDDTVRLIAPEIEEKRLALRVTIAPAARRPVLGDALAFRQIATNLIGNALKFTDSGGIGVELGIGERRRADPRGVGHRARHRPRRSTPASSSASCRWTGRRRGASAAPGSGWRSPARSSS